MGFHSNPSTKLEIFYRVWVISIETQTSVQIQIKNDVRRMKMIRVNDERSVNKSVRFWN
jgi:hypothetical protein